MIKRLIAILILGVSAASLSAAIIDDHFSNGNYTSDPTWTADVRSGDGFTVPDVGGVHGYVVNLVPNGAAGESYLHTSMPTISDFTMSIDFCTQTTMGSTFMVFGIGTEGASNNYYVSIAAPGVYGGVTNVAVFGGGPPAEVLYRTGVTGGDPMDGAWHTITIARYGSGLSCYMDGSPNPFISFNDSTYTEFNEVFFGGSTVWQYVQFDNVLVIPEPITMSLLVFGGAMMLVRKRK